MKNKKVSPNILTCQISGETRMSNAQYLQNKADKKGVSVEEFKSNYVSKSEYAKIPNAVDESNLDLAADQLQIDRERLKSFLKLNGRGKYAQKES